MSFLGASCSDFNSSMELVAVRLTSPHGQSTMWDRELWSRVKTLLLARVTERQIPWANGPKGIRARFHDSRSTTTPQSARTAESVPPAEGAPHVHHPISPPPELEEANRKLTRAYCLGERLVPVDAEP